MRKSTIGITAHLCKGVRSIFPKGCRFFFFPTMIQGEVESAMTYMGFGSSQYYLSYGEYAGDRGAEDVPPVKIKIRATS